MYNGELRLTASPQDGTLNGSILSPTSANYSPIDFQATRYPYPTVKTLLSPLDALAKVRASAGASKSRDSIDNYLINTELASYGKVGALISDPTASPINGPGTIAGGTVRDFTMVGDMKPNTCSSTATQRYRR